MNNKTCGECRYMLHKDTFEVCTHSMTETSMFDEACKHFTPPTNGDVIRQGGNDALIDFADGIRRRMCHYCAFSKDKSCVDKTGDCWEGIRAWLNAPAESEGEDE